MTGRRAVGSTQLVFSTYGTKSIVIICTGICGG